MRLLCFLVALLCAGGCVRHKPGHYPADLVAIDSLLRSDAEKGWALLADYDAGGLSRTSKAYYGLLYTIAADKLDSVFQSDSLINDASYRLRHDPMQHARSMFYSGLVRYRINKEDTVAFQRMVEARNICEKYKIEEPFLRGMIAYYLAANHLFYNNCTEALTYQQEAIKYGSMQDDTLSQLADKIGLSSIYISMDSLDEAEKILRSLPPEETLSLDFQSHIYSLCSLLSELQDDNEKSLYYIKKLLLPDFADYVNEAPLYYSMSSIFHNLNMPDSALYYGEKAIASIKDTSILYYEAFRHTAVVASELKNYKIAAQYFEQALNLSLDYAEEIAKQRLIEIEKRYDMLRVKQESAEEKAQLHKYIAILVVALLIVLIVLFLHYAKHVKRKAQETEIQDNLQKQKVASNALLLTLKYNAEMDERIEIISNKENIANINIKNELQKLKKQTRKVTLDNIYNLLVDNELMADTDELNGFKFTKEELLINYFMNQGWDNKQIAQIINSTPQIIKTKKYQINQKIDGKSTPQPLETE